VQATATAPVQQNATGEVRGNIPRGRGRIRSPSCGGG